MPVPKLHWSRLRSIVVVALHGVGRRVPRPVVRLLIRTVVRTLRLLYWVPGNPLRRACADIAAVATAHGLSHRPSAIHRRFFDQVQAVALGFVDVYHGGPDAVADRIDLDDQVMAGLQERVDRHGGVVLAVSHNIASVFSAIGLCRHTNPLLLVRNRKGNRHNAVADEMFVRMGIETLNVRSLSPVAFSRACMRALAKGRLLVATVDTVWRRPDPVMATIFGQEQRFPPWAVRMAAKRGSPFVPCYPRLENGRVVAWMAEPIIDDDPAVLTRHYVRHLERCVLRDPASWAFIADKRWRRLIRQARHDIESGAFSPPDLADAAGA